METDVRGHEPPAAVETFLRTVTSRPTSRWHEIVSAARGHTFAHRTTAVALCHAILTHENQGLPAWFTEDAARTASAEIGLQLSPAEQALVHTLLAQAALSILARPALPTLDFALLLAPFLPLHLP